MSGRDIGPMWFISAKCKQFWPSVSVMHGLPGMKGVVEEKEEEDDEEEEENEEEDEEDEDEDEEDEVEEGSVLLRKAKAVIAVVR
jgi:hypothetical protein